MLHSRYHIAHEDDSSNKLPALIIVLELKIQINLEFLCDPLV
jgi:hypothetical protein